jgi:hypothetical protein
VGLTGDDLRKADEGLYLSLNSEDFRKKASRLRMPTVGNSKVEGLERSMVDAARTTDVPNPKHRAARLIHPTTAPVL